MHFINLNRIIPYFKSLKGEYPRQFWLLFWGMLISATGSSMIWPFLMIYVGDRLNLPLSSITFLTAVNAVAGLSSFFVGPLVDRLGRKWVMAISLAMNGIGYILMSQAHTLGQFAALMALQGAFNPLYRMGSDAMIADLIPPEKRTDAYGLLRMVHNAGIALGPSMGGLIASQSYTLAFILAAASLLTYSAIVTFFCAETLVPHPDQAARPKEVLGGYDRVFSDSRFVSFVGAMVLNSVASTIMWVLLSVHAVKNYGLTESMYGLIPTTNALMVVLLQIPITRITRRYKVLPVLMVGATLYALGVGSVALGNGFWAFWLSMVIMSLGELVLMPTASTYTASLAPADMRGRYMSVYGLTWSAGYAIGPSLGGFLNDRLGPQFIWLGGGTVGLMAAAIFALKARRAARQADLQPANHS